MLVYGLPVVFALFVWWFSTGAVLYVIGMPRRTFPASLAIATVVLAVALYAVWVSASDTSVSGAYIAFTAAIAVWGWHEMSFLTGLVTGPRTTPLPEGRTNGAARLWPAIEVLIYHELAIFLTVGLLVALTSDAPNQVALWTFVILWIMRLSAKFNVYLGVPNLTEEFLPEHLVYLKTYFRRRPMNLLFPVAVTASTVVAVMLIQAASAATSDFEAAGLTFLSALMVLAVLEHWFLVVPLPAAELWSWGMASRKTIETKTPSDPTAHKSHTSDPSVVAAPRSVVAAT